jgi:L-ascorbate metabolism protein UlaG (beta-lactamase superfamily)
MRRTSTLLLGSVLAFLASACIHVTASDAARAKVAPSWPERVTHPARDDARLSVLWIGHATVLVQIDDKFVLTDPVFAGSVGMLSARFQPPGLDPRDLPPLDAVLVSHVHMDHLSPSSLLRIADKTRQLLIPPGSLMYVPDAATPTRELGAWQTWEKDGLRITAVPVKHVGGRYGLDQLWMPAAFTGYVIEYHGLVVYFGGDTAYDHDRFVATAARFPKIDLALIPIAPIEPRDLMKHTHVDPFEAVRAFLDLGAKRMVPIHFDTFPNSGDEPGDAPRELERVKRGLHLGDDVIPILRVGEPRVLLGRAADADGNLGRAANDDRDCAPPRRTAAAARSSTSKTSSSTHLVAGAGVSAP